MLLYNGGCSLIKWYLLMSTQMGMCDPPLRSIHYTWVHSVMHAFIVLSPVPGQISPDIHWNLVPISSPLSNPLPIYYKWSFYFIFLLVMYSQKVILNIFLMLKFMCYFRFSIAKIGQKNCKTTSRFL